MALKEKLGVIKEHQRHAKDTGSAEVQIAILTNRINHIVEHLKINKKDFHTQRGLLILVGQRKKLLTYLSRTENETYQQLIKKLGLKK